VTLRALDPSPAQEALGVRVLARAHPFSAARTDTVAAAGLTIAQIVAGAVPDHALWPYVHVTVARGGGEPAPVPRAAWARVRPRPGALVRLVVVPMGGGGGGKNPFRLVLSIAVIAASFFLGPALGAALGLPQASTLGGLLSTPINLASAVGGFIITTVGTLLINALVPPPKPQLSALSLGERTSPQLALTGVSNRANPYGPVLRVYGRHRVFPVLAARTISEAEGDKQYLRALFDFGYGPLDLSDIRIGTVPIEQFAGVELQIRPGRDDDPPQTLYPQTVREDGYSMRLRFGAAQVVETRDEAREALIDLTFLGLVTFSTETGARQNRTVEVRYEYRRLGDPAWTLHAERAYTAATDQRVVRGERIPFPAPGRYELRLTRLTADSTSSSVRDDTYLTAVRSVAGDYPIRARGRCLLALRIQATDQLSGQLDQVNAVAQARLPVWTGSAWVEQPTSNPAWAYLDVLRGRANRRPIAAAQLDLPAFLDWATACDAAPPVGAGPRWSFNAVYDFRTTVFQALSDIAAAGRAAFAMRDGRFSIVRDVPQTVPIQHFSPRNSRGFTGRRVFRRPAHALVCRYIEPAREWSQQEVTVYADGYDETTATEIETIERFGCTNRDQAWRDTRYDMAVAQLRPDTYQLTTDIEHLICTRGDLVRVTHDVPAWGVTSGRIVAVATDSAGDVTGLTLDEPVPMQAGRAYAVRIRRADASSVVATLVTQPGEQATVTLATPIPAASAPQAGDLVLVGEAGRESVELIVKEIKPGPDLSATLTMIDAAPAVHAAETAPIPPYDPQATDPPVVTRPRPRVPLITEIYSDGRALWRAGDGTLLARIAVTARPDPLDTLPGLALQLRWRPEGSAEAWRLGAATAWAERSALHTEPLEEGTRHEIQVRAVTALGETGDWTAPVVHEVEGERAPPRDVAGFVIDGRTLRWQANDELDVVGYRIRWIWGTEPAWEAATPAHDWLVTAAPFTLAHTPAGQIAIMIKAVDRGGRESATPALIITELGDPPLRFGAARIDYHALAFPGTRTDCALDGGDLAADAEPGGPMWLNALALMWSADATTAMWDEPVWRPMTYQDVVEFTPPLPVGARIVVTAELQGAPARIWYRRQAPMWTDDGAAMWTGDATLMWSAQAGDWLPWPGSVEAGALDLRVEIGGGATRGRIRALEATLDVEPIVETFADVALAAAGSRLALTRDYVAIGAVVVTLQGATSARGVRVLDKDVTLGPLIQAVDSAGNGVAASVDATVYGY
jgi:hypothetical protein